MDKNTEAHRLVKNAMVDVETFIENCSNLTLRDYQRQPARAIVQSILAHDGNSFVVMFPRQSGKNELQAQLETYLLCLTFTCTDAEIVKVSPTWKPQTLNAMRRLERVLSVNEIGKHL